MEIKDIMIKIGNYEDWINEIFPDKDYITLEELINKLEEVKSDKDHLEEVIQEKENKIQELYDFYVN